MTSQYLQQLLWSQLHRPQSLLTCLQRQKRLLLMLLQRKERNLCFNENSRGFAAAVFASVMSSMLVAHVHHTSRTVAATVRRVTSV